MNFLGTKLFYGRPGGVLLTVEMVLVYLSDFQFGNLFTNEIYEKRESENKQGKEK